MLNRLWTTILITFLICTVFVIGFAIELYSFSQTPLIPVNQSVDYVLPSGVGSHALLQDLKKLGILNVRQKILFRLA